MFKKKKKPNLFEGVPKGKEFSHLMTFKGDPNVGELVPRYDFYWLIVERLAELEKNGKN